MITERQIQTIVDGMEIHFEDLGWDKIDSTVGINWLSQVLLILTINKMPLQEIKFVEVLRSLANGLEILIEEAQK